MGAAPSSDSSGSSVDINETWCVEEEVRKWGEKRGMPVKAASAMGDTTLFLGGPEFDETQIDAVSDDYQSFSPNRSSSWLDLQTEGDEGYLPSSEEEVTEVITSYDRIPKAPEPDYAYMHSPVRGKRARMQLPGWECRDCKEFYDAAGLSAKARKKLVGRCSRHRSKHPRSKTPERFWAMGMGLSDSAILRRQLGQDQS